MPSAPGHFKAINLLNTRKLEKYDPFYWVTVKVCWYFLKHICVTSTILVLYSMWHYFFCLALCKLWFGNLIILGGFVNLFCVVNCQTCQTCQGRYKLARPVMACQGFHIWRHRQSGQALTALDRPYKAWQLNINISWFFFWNKKPQNVTCQSLSQPV